MQDTKQTTTTNAQAQPSPIRATVMSYQNRYKLHEDGTLSSPQIIRDTNGVFGLPNKEHRIIGAVRFNNFGRIAERKTLEQILAGEIGMDWYHGNGKQNWHLVDNYGGAERVWDGPLRHHVKVHEGEDYHRAENYGRQNYQHTRNAPTRKFDRLEEPREASFPTRQTAASAAYAGGGSTAASGPFRPLSAPLIPPVTEKRKRGRPRKVVVPA